MVHEEKYLIFCLKYMSATNCSSSTAIGAAAAQSPTAAADASNIVPPQRKSSNIDATILGVAASPLKPTIAAGVSADEDRPLKIVSRENSPVVAQPQTPIILVDPQPKPKNDAASNPLRKSSPPPPPPQQRQTPAVAPPQPQPTFISQPTPVMGGTTAVPPPQPHGFLIGSPHNNNNIAAAASMPYGFFAAAAAAAAQQQHAAILLNSCPPLTFLPQIIFQDQLLIVGPYTGAAYHDPTIMPNWNGHFLVRTATGQLMALAVNNTPNLSAAHHQTVQRTTPLTQTSTNFLPPLNNNNETPRNQPPVNKTTTTTTTSIFPNRPPTATPILQKTLILPSKDQSRRGLFRFLV
uniref:Uncharacterized protein n=1 Tax=Romanomermis culicivorax TaxID=13658 RepID=A0A915KZF3_ROMCU